MMIRGYEVAGRAIAAAVGLIIIIALVIYVPGCIRKDRSQAAQARLDAEQGKAAVESGKDAIGTVAASGETTAASDQATRENERTIRDAQGSSDRVNPALRDAGFASLCRRPSFANSATGKLRCPAP